MQFELFKEQIGVSAIGAIIGIGYLWAALRMRRHGEGSATARFALAAVSFVIAAVVVLRELEPIAGYSILLLSWVAVYLVDLLQNERARSRRVAMLAPRPTAEGVPIVWIVITLLATLTLVPDILAGSYSIPALISGGCAIAMAAISWRIASAPTQLTGEDPQSERISERLTRTRQSGMACVMACVIVYAFLCFINARLQTPEGIETARAIGLVTVGLMIWLTLYVRLLFTRRLI